MTRDDIIRVAQDAGLPLTWISEYGVRLAALIAAEKDKQIAFLKDSHDAIRELAYKTGVEAEREACARFLDDQWFKTQSECAAAIRARGEA